MNRSPSTHLAGRSPRSPAAPPRELLIDIFSDSGKARPTLLFNRRDPTSVWERFVNWLFRPIQRIKARDHIESVMRKAGQSPNGKNLTELSSVKALNKEVLASGLLRGVAEETVQTAMLEMRLHGYQISEEFEPLIDTAIHTLNEYYSLLCNNEDDLKKGLKVLIDFANNLEGTVTREGENWAGKFIEHIEKPNDPPLSTAPDSNASTVDRRMYDQLQMIFNSYQDVFTYTRDRIARVDRSESCKTSTDRTPVGNDADLAMLYSSLPKTATQGIKAFERLLTNGNSTAEMSKTDLGLLEEFTIYFSNYLLALDADTLDRWLPEVLRIAEKVFVAEFSEKADTCYSLISRNQAGPRRLAKLVENESFDKGQAANRCALELTRYLERTAEISQLEIEIEQLEKKKTELEEKIRKLDEQIETKQTEARKAETAQNQKHVARRESNLRERANEARLRTTREIESLNNELHETREALAIPLQYPLHRLMLFQAISEAGRLSAQLDRKDREQVAPVLRELIKQFRAFAPVPPTVSQSAPASQSPDPAASSRSARN